MTTLRDAEEVAREVCHRLFRTGPHINAPVPLDPVAIVTAAIHEARREMREVCAGYCERHSMGTPLRHTQAEFAGYVAEDRAGIEDGSRHTGQAYAAAIRSLPIGDEAEDVVREAIANAQYTSSTKNAQVAVTALREAGMLKEDV